MTPEAIALCASMEAFVKSLLPVAPAAKPGLRLGAVSYYRPGPLWDAVLRLAPNVGFTIINPASGPGRSPDAAYYMQVTMNTAANVPTLGYLTTNYRDAFGVQSDGIKRDLANIANVYAEIDSYFNWYPKTAGVFLDEMNNDGSALSLQYYSLIKDRIRSHGKIIVQNPGTKFPENYIDLADTFMSFEGTAAKYAAYVPQTWMKNHRPEKFYHCVHDALPADYASIVTACKGRNAGYLWVTGPAYSANPAEMDKLAALVSA